MAQYTSTKCDRCGKDIVNTSGCYNENYALRHYSAKLTVWGVGELRSSMGNRIDLCTDCYNDFIDFLEFSKKGGEKYE